jgi:hypothetical protein
LLLVGGAHRSPLATDIVTEVEGFCAWEEGGDDVVEVRPLNTRLAQDDNRVGGDGVNVLLGDADEGPVDRPRIRLQRID